MFSGESHTTLNGTMYRATGSKGETVVVEASHEAIRDYGEAAVKHKASEKYDGGQVQDHRFICRKRRQIPFSRLSTNP